MYKFWLLAVVLLGFGCGGGNVVLDNPRGESAEFIIDGEVSHVVAAGERAEISLDAGTHSLQVIAGGETVADTSFQLAEGGLIHSGAKTYLIWRQLYGLQKDRKTLLNESWVEFDSIRTFGDFKLFPPSVVFLEKTWDYGLDEEFPASHSLYITSDFVIESKVFESKEFIRYYKEKAAASRP